MTLELVYRLGVVWLLLLLEAGDSLRMSKGMRSLNKPELSRDLVIIGSGPAGCTAAIYAGRALLTPLVIAGYNAGGQLMLTSDVENFPGYPAGRSGPDVMDDMISQAKRFGAEFWQTDCASIDTSSRPFRVHTDNCTVLAKAIIVASGAKSKWLGAANEELYKGTYLSTCATCDGYLSRGKDVVVVGGGDSAMEEASFLTRFARRVNLVHRRSSFKASKVMLDRVKANPKVKLWPNKVVNRWIGKSRELTEVEIVDANDASRINSIPCQSGFIAIGHQPNTLFLKKQVKLDPLGYIELSKAGSTATSVDGVFACGDVCDPKYKQAVTAAASGCQAAIDAEKWLENEKLAVRSLRCNHGS